MQRNGIVHPCSLHTVCPSPAQPQLLSPMFSLVQLSEGTAHSCSYRIWALISALRYGARIHKSIRPWPKTRKCTSQRIRFLDIPKVFMGSFFFFWKSGQRGLRRREQSFGCGRTLTPEREWLHGYRMSRHGFYQNTQRRNRRKSSLQGKPYKPA